MTRWELWLNSDHEGREKNDNNEETCKQNSENSKIIVMEKRFKF